MENQTPPVSQPMAESRKFSFYAVNSSSEPWAIAGSDLTHGKWQVNPINVPGYADNVLAFEAEGRANAAEGCQGWVSYNYPALYGPVVLQLNFNVPWVVIQIFPLV